MPSLYANLLEPDAQAATISAAPVKYEFKQAPADEEKKPDASLRFQPVKRPNAAQKQRPRPSAPHIPVVKDTTPAQASNIEKWTATEEDLELAAQNNRRQRGGKRKKKDQKRLKLGDFYANDDEYEDVDFDAIYDPARHTNLKAYQHSDEYYDAIRDWKDRLHAHEKKDFRSRSRRDSSEAEPVRLPKQAFAPPPSILADATFTPAAMAPEHPPVSQDAGDEAYLARSRMSLPSGADVDRSEAGITSAPPAPYPSSATISAAPVHYTQPPAPSPPSAAPEATEPRSLRPGQKGFAQRLLEKYGWQSGQGLGATGSGITTILQHQPLKRKKRPDAQGGGYAPAVGRIVGGKKRRASPTPAEQGWTSVVRFAGMLRGQGDARVLLAEAGLMQRLGEAMEIYGKVEALKFRHADEEDEGPGAVVFVKFTSPLSAFNAIKAAAGARDFLGNGNAAKADYFEEERFEKGDLADTAEDGPGDQPA